MTTAEEKRARRAASQRKYYAANKEKLTEKTRKYRAENQEKTRAYGRENYARNKEKLNARSKAYSKTIGGRYSIYKRGALKRDLAFELSLDEFGTYWGVECHYCGVSMEDKIGIDRVDNDIGYVGSNCVSSCRTCNVMKQTLGIDEFIAHCKRIVAHSSSTNDTEFFEWYTGVWEEATVLDVEVDIKIDETLSSVRRSG